MSGRKQPPDPKRRSPPAAEAASSADGPRILVADDEDGTLSLMTTTLTYAGFTVIPARDGLEAIQRARETIPDLALLDVMMPGMDGREVCRRIVADPALTHVPIILQSAADEEDIDWRGCGADAFLRKPFSVRELPALVRQHLASTRRVNRPTARRLTDEEVLELARRIRQAVRRPPDGDPRQGVLSPHRELSPEDEGRVEAALLALLGTAQEPRSPDGPFDAGERAIASSDEEDDDGAPS